MTRLYEECAGPLVEHPNRVGLRNFNWTHQAIQDWEAIWNTLWSLGYKWEWQNHDRYVRRRGSEYVKFGVHDDAYRLDMAVPLPQVHVIEEARELLLDNPDRDARIGHVIGAINAWLKTHYAP